jgi:hypothetical protein
MVLIGVDRRSVGRDNGLVLASSRPGLMSTGLEEDVERC